MKIYYHFMVNYIVLIGQIENLEDIGIMISFIIMQLDYFIVKMVKIILLIIQNVHLLKI